MAGGTDFRTTDSEIGVSRWGQSWAGPVGVRVGPDRWGSELGRTGGGQSWAGPVGQSHRISSMLV